jgi:hypothetical protein
MTSVKYIGMDVHTESISIAVRNSLGKIVMESVIETKASTLLQFLDGLRGDLRVVFEEGTWATWLYELLKPTQGAKIAHVPARPQERMDRRYSSAGVRSRIRKRIPGNLACADRPITVTAKQPGCYTYSVGA